MSSFAGKVFLITGSSNGIGRGTAVLFAKQGAKVAITGRNAESLEETKKLCLKAGARPEHLLELLGDVTDEVFNEKLVDSTVKKFGRLDVLVNNVGSAAFDQFGKKILEIPFSGFEKMIDINVKPVLSLSRFAVPHLEKSKGAIVNVSSTAAFHKLNPMPLYCAAKSALDQITIQMAGTLIKLGIRVNSVNPGAVATNFGVTSGAPKEIGDKMVQALAPGIPLCRLGVPEDIGKSEILVGRVLTADGGVNFKSASFPTA